MTTEKILFFAMVAMFIWVAVYILRKDKQERKELE